LLRACGPTVRRLLSPQMSGETRGTGPRACTRRAEQTDSQRSAADRPGRQAGSAAQRRLEIVEVSCCVMMLQQELDKAGRQRSEGGVGRLDVEASEVSLVVDVAASACDKEGEKLQ